MTEDQKDMLVSNLLRVRELLLIRVISIEADIKNIIIEHLIAEGKPDANGAMTRAKDYIEKIRLKSLGK